MSFSNYTETDLSLPLSAMEAVVIDSETTGLNPKTDRVIELAGVAIYAGQIVADADFQTLIDPQVPIPKKSTAIHNLTDEDIKGSPNFVDGFASFSSWVNSRFVIGYSIGFDLAIFAQEHQRHGLVWNEPISLDVEELIRVIAPNLPNYSLETVASWLQVPLENRHRALPDALITSQVFLQLIPKLREINVLSVAEARLAIEKVGNREGEMIRNKLVGQKEIVHFDTYPYRVRVGEIMNPPQIVSSQTIIREVVNTLIAKSIGSVIVELEQDHHGILTEKDIIRAIQINGPEVLSQRVSQYCSYNLELIHQKEFVYRAMVTMGDKGYKRLAVCNDEGDIVGLISSADIFGNYSFDAIGLGRDILEAKNPEELGRVWSGLASVTRSLIFGGTEPRTIAAIISRELRGITHRACVIAEAEILAKTQTKNLPNYSMIVLGSGGRGESLLAMDQDNAMIFDSHDAIQDTEPLLGGIAKRVSDILHQTGITYCPGGVMASNQEWRRNQAEWRTLVQYWISRTSPEDLLNADIFFDSMPVYGDEKLANTLRSEAIELARKAKPFLTLLSLRASNFNVALGMFNKVKLTDGRVDLKLGGIMPIFSTARVVALRHGIKPRSTAARLREFKNMNIVPDQIIDNLLSAHEIFLELIMRQQIADLEKGLKPSNKIATKGLQGIHQQKLKWALDKLHTIPNVLGTPV
ncbi:MAG: DUF294 nucleotidyltransferase-like domain-containing protein [Rhodobacteraceae bacterium]|nr:DUF294 nucleotidyltransferase-like domain-containing protein [Paracoccaceae bacterium]